MAPLRQSNFSFILIVIAAGLRVFIIPRKSKMVAAADNIAALRVLAKLLMTSACSILLIRNTNVRIFFFFFFFFFSCVCGVYDGVSCRLQVFGQVVGVLMQGICFSWLYMVGLDCAKRSFFSASVANDWVGTIALAPLLRPLRLLRDKSRASRALVYQMLDVLFGTSVSHVAVDAFLLVAVPLMWYLMGWWAICKYWLLPLLVAHVNAGSLLDADSPASSVLFPHLKGVQQVPFYRLGDSKNTMLDGAGVSVNSRWLWQVTQEVLLWRKRDVLVHLFLLTGGVLALLNPSLRNWATLPVLLLLPLMAVKSQAASLAAASCSMTERKRVVGEISHEQLRSMHTLAAVQGMIIDLELLSQTHPGGDLIRSVGGTECTGLFGSMHAYTAVANLAKLKQFQVGTLREHDKVVQFELNTPFAVELRSAIRHAMQGVSFYAPIGWWVRCALILVGTLLSEWVWAMTGSLWAMVATGTFHALIGICVQHDGSHGAISANPSINAFFSYGADWIGSNRGLWFQQHVVGHHPHCNIEGVDPDAHSAEPLLQFHWAPGVMRQWLLRYQWL